MRPSDSPSSTATLRGSASGPIAGHLDKGLLVFEEHQPLGDQHDVVLLADHDIGVGRVAGPQGHLLIRIELDLDIEEGRALALLGLRRDPRQAPGDDVVGQGADLDPARHTDRDLADVDLVDRALEDQIAHVGDGGELGARLVGGQRHHRVTDVDGPATARCRWRWCG